MAVRVFASLAVLASGTVSFGQTVVWADMTSGTTGRPGTVSGTFDFPPAGAGPEDVGFTYTGEVSNYQLGGGSSYWIPTDAYLSPSVTNAPPTSDIISMNGGAPLVTSTITFSRPVRNPLMAVLSVGAPSRPVTYNFDTPIDVLSSGRGYWGSGPLVELEGNVMEGREGHGVVRINSVVTQFSWTIPVYESWHGFTFGLFSDAACGADFNGDGFLDFFDYDDFVNCFENAVCPTGRTADFNGDGFVDFFDYDAYVGAFETGC